MTRLGGLATVVGILAWSGPASAQGERLHALDQPAQPLAQALIALSRRTGAIIVAPAALTTGRAAPRLSGRMSVREAVARLLASDGLTFTINPAGVVVVQAARPVVAERPRVQPPAPPPEDLALSPVTVIARPLGEPGERLDRFSARPIEILMEDDLRRAGVGGVGDAIARLPGASASLDAGEARQIAVRGVGARFTRVRINGMETLATFGATNAGGGTNRGRAFDYNVFAADLFHEVRVQKTASADLEEGSLGASIDMRTRSPFDRPARSALVYVEQSYNSGADRGGGRGSLVLSARGDRLGLLVSAAHGRRRTAERGTSAGQWETGAAIFPGFGASTAEAGLDALNAALHARIPRLEYIRSDQRRTGLSGTLEWRPDDRTRVSADVLYAELEVDRREDLLGSFTFRTAGLGRGALNGVTVREARVVDLGGRTPVLIAGRFDGVDVRSEARHDVLETLFRQSTLTATRRFDNGVKASLLLGYSRSDFSNPVQDTLWLEQGGVTGFGYDFGGHRPRIDFGSTSLTSESAWRLAEFRSEPNWVDNTYRSAAFDVEREGPLAWRAGWLTRTYRHDAVTLARSDGGIGNVNSDLPAAWRIAPIGPISRLVDAGLGVGPWRGVDVPLALDRFGGAPLLGPGPAAALNYDVSERIDAVYVQLARSHQPDRRFWGEAGLRWVEARYDASGLSVDAQGGLTVATGARRDRRLLPSMNLAWRLAPAAVLRFGAARVVARPDLASLRPGVGLTTNGTKLVAAGNPDLEPTQADTFDLALQWRPRAETTIDLAVFHKSIATLVQSTITRPLPFAANPYGLPVAVATAACGSAPGCSADLPIWQFARPENSGPGALDGAELAVASRLSRSWRVQAAMSYARTTVRLIGKTGAIEAVEDALGAPRLAAFLALDYHRGPLELRGAVSRRGAFVASAPAPNGGAVDGVEGVTRLDASARLKLSPAADLTVEALNLTNAAERQFSDTPHIPTYRHQTGRDLRVGFSLRY